MKKKSIILIFGLIIVITIFAVIFGTTKSDKKSVYDENDVEIEEETSKLTKKDICKIKIKDVEYDLTKPVKEIGFKVKKIYEISSDNISNYDDFNDSDIYEQEECEKVILKPGQKVICDFGIGIGSGEIINPNNTEKNILDCNIARWSNTYVLEGYGDLNGISVGKTTKDELIKKYGSTIIDCTDGSSVAFSFGNENDKYYDGKLKTITINLKY